MKQLVVIGGGVSGMTCAMVAARYGAQVLVLERGRKTLRKLAASGNGRGNLLNCGELLYHGDEAFARQVFSEIKPTEVASFWQALGVSLAEEEQGRVYPSCFQAAQAAEAMRLSAVEAGVLIRCNCQVTDVCKTETGFLISGEESLYAKEQVRKNGKTKAGELLEVKPFQIFADDVVLAFGGASAPEFGTDGSAFLLAQKLGHRVTELRPSLCALTTSIAIPPALQGQRARALLTLKAKNGGILHESAGEILFADHAISGIAAMQLARYAEEGCTLEINFTPTLCGKALASYKTVLFWLERLQEQFPNRKPEDLLTGCASEPLRRFICASCSLEEMAKRIISLPLPIEGTKGFAFSQVTAGGVHTAEIHSKTMESKLLSGLYLLGEALNVDGDCGGYNLMFAVACGILAGRDIGKNIQG